MKLVFILLSYQSLTSGVCRVHTAHLSSEEPQFKGSVATRAWQLLSQTPQLRSTTGFQEIQKSEDCVNTTTLMQSAKSTNSDFLENSTEKAI